MWASYVEVSKSTVRKSEFPWNFVLVLASTDDCLSECVTWWFCKRDPNYHKDLPGTLGDQMPCRMGTGFGGGTMLFLSPCVQKPPCGLCRAIASAKEQHKDILRCWWPSSVADETALWGLKKSQNEKQCVNKWKLNECVSINMLHSPCALVKK